MGGVVAPPACPTAHRRLDARCAKPGRGLRFPGSERMAARSRRSKHSEPANMSLRRASRKLGDMEYPTGPERCSFAPNRAPAAIAADASTSAASMEIAALARTSRRFSSSPRRMRCRPCSAGSRRGRSESTKTSPSRSSTRYASTSSAQGSSVAPQLMSKRAWCQCHRGDLSLFLNPACRRPARCSQPEPAQPRLPASGCGHHRVTGYRRGRHCRRVRGNPGRRR